MGGGATDTLSSMQLAISSLLCAVVTSVGCGASDPAPGTGADESGAGGTAATTTTGGAAGSSTSSGASGSQATSTTTGSGGSGAISGTGGGRGGGIGRNHWAGGCAGARRP